MAYLFRYRISQPSARSDGSGMVNNQTMAIYSTDDGDTWQVVPARNKTIVCPASEVQTCLAGPGIAELYKDMLARNLNTMAEPIVGWGTAQLTEMLDNNAAAAAAAAAVAVLPVSWPYEFSM